MNRRLFLTTLAASMIVKAQREPPVDELPFWARARTYVSGSSEDVHQEALNRLVFHVRLKVDGQWIALSPEAAEEWFMYPDERRIKS